MSLLTVDMARMLIDTDLSDPNLADLIDREEAALIAHYGAHYAPATTITALLNGGGPSIYLPRAIGSVSSISETVALGEMAQALTITDYYVWPSEGRITRLPERARWARLVTVVYVPANDTAERVQVLIELLRQGLTRTAYQSETRSRNGMTYSYQAPTWELERGRILQRLGFIGL